MIEFKIGLEKTNKFAIITKFIYAYTLGNLIK